MPKSKKAPTHATCTEIILPIKDALAILNGKWKLPIITLLSFGPRRFNQIKEIIGITDKVLSRELKELEANQLIKRTINDSFSSTVVYSTTPHGLSLEKVIMELRNWGVFHRKIIMGK